MKRFLFIVLLLGYLVLGGFWVNHKFTMQKEVSSYIEAVTDWNKKQVALQDRYTNDVLKEKDPKISTPILAKIVQDNEKLLQETKAFETNSLELQHALSLYQKGIHGVTDGYRLYYHAMNTNDAAILKDGDEALKEANLDFQAHEEVITELADKNFINLSE